MVISMATIRGIGLAKVILTRGIEGLGFTAIIMMDGEAIGKVEDYGDGAPANVVIHPDKEDEFTSRMNKYYEAEGITLFSPYIFLEDIRLLGGLEKAFGVKTKTSPGSLHKIKSGILVVGFAKREHDIDDVKYTTYDEVLSVVIYTTDVEHAIEKAKSMTKAKLDKIKTFDSVESFNL